MDTKIPIFNDQPAAYTTADSVAQALRDAILRGALRGGQPLRQEELAEQFGVSRIPIREALWQLSAEGLVVLAPNRGAAVAALSADEVQEIYDIRIGLETTALRLAIPNLSPAILARARDVLDAIDGESQVALWAALNWDFHATLYAPAGRPRLLALIKTMHDNVGRYLRIYLSIMQFQSRSQEEHRALLAACQRYDSGAALDLLTQHLADAGARLAAYLREQGTLAPARLLRDSA
jgi:DNA-binding GntR family transcriptional regulator